MVAHGSSCLAICSRALRPTELPGVAHPELQVSYVGRDVGVRHDLVGAVRVVPEHGPLVLVDRTGGKANEAIQAGGLQGGRAKDRPAGGLVDCPTHHVAVEEALPSDRRDLAGDDEDRVDLPLQALECGRFAYADPGAD